MIIQFTEMSYIPKPRRRYGAVQDDVLTLLHSVHNACEIDLSPYKTPSTGSACYYNAVKRLWLQDAIAVTIRDGRMFLVKKEAAVDAESN